MVRSEPKFMIKHYGPGTAPDFDHSTSILVERLEHGIRGIIALENDAELDHLITCLIVERNKCPDSPWAIKGPSES
jgi:hypothetical protein